MTESQFLQNMLNYYCADPLARRCVSISGGCKYSPVSINKLTSEGCAIGRHLSPDVQIKFDNQICAGIEDILDKKYLKELMPKWMQNMNEDFLSDSQALHDMNIFWDDKGLSNEGISRVEEIIKKFDLKDIKIPSPN